MLLWCLWASAPPSHFFPTPGPVADEVPRCAVPWSLGLLYSIWFLRLTLLDHGIVKKKKKGERKKRKKEKHIPTAGTRWFSILFLLQNLPSHGFTSFPSTNPVWSCVVGGASVISRCDYKLHSISSDSCQVPIYDDVLQSICPLLVGCVCGENE